MYVNSFEYLLAFIGGSLIFLATTLNLLAKGRITGMSGLISGIISHEGTPWKLSILTGMIVTSSIFWLIFQFKPLSNSNTYIFSPPDVQIQGLDIFGFTISGFLVGLGTKLGNGCTSGHGVCGLPRFSLRSYVAVAIFMSFGIGMSTLRYYYPFLSTTEGTNLVNKIQYEIAVPVIMGITLALYIGYCIYYKRTERQAQMLDLLISFFIGVIFCTGLIISGMIKREKIVGFLSIQKNWDPSLMIVMMSACVPNFITFYFIQKRPQPLFSDKFCVPAKGEIDKKLVIGAALFGIGWGMGGLCPGPAFVLFGIFSPHISIAFLGSVFAAHYLINKINESLEKNDEQQKVEQYELIKK